MPPLPSARRRAGDLFHLAATTAALPDAGEDGEEDKRPDADGDTDDDVAVVVDPGADGAAR